MLSNCSCKYNRNLILWLLSFHISHGEIDCFLILVLVDSISEKIQPDHRSKHHNGGNREGPDGAECCVAAHYYYGT